MCCANPKGRAPECARTRTHTRERGRVPTPSPDLFPAAALPGDGDAGAPALDQVWSLAGEEKIKPNLCSHHSGLCTFMAMAEAAREGVIHPLQPWPAQRMAFSKKLPQTP